MANFHGHFQAWSIKFIPAWNLHTLSFYSVNSINPPLALLEQNTHNKSFFWMMWYFHEVIDTKQTFIEEEDRERGLVIHEGETTKNSFWFGGGKYCHCCYIIEYWFREDIKTWEKQINIFRDNKWKRYTDLLMSSW